MSQVAEILPRIDEGNVSIVNKTGQQNTRSFIIAHDKCEIISGWCEHTIGNLSIRCAEIANMRSDGHLVKS